VSPTGVLGIMQITAATAAFLKIPDRTDPAQSIWGGARYIAQLAAQLPAEITDPDRTWMALAAYNMGLGHLYDARKLTDEQGGDPNRWLDVRNSLPLLTQSKWHTKTKHGYARGHQAVIYVGNVRTYYDMLVWITGSPAQALPQEVPPDTEVPAPPDNPLNIRSPVL
jgi:membrane-bound lytic murein transglycosylase F